MLHIDQVTIVHQESVQDQIAMLNRQIPILADKATNQVIQEYRTTIVIKE